MADNKITWEPPESKKEIKHSELIEKFVNCYIVKEIFPEPNPFLLKADIKSGNNAEQPHFEQIELCTDGNLSLSFNPRCVLSKYKIDMFGVSESKLVTEKRSRIGRIYHGRIFSPDKKYELESFYFSPSSNSFLRFRNEYAKDAVQLIYNPNFHYVNYRKQVFVPETGQITVKDK
jgi:hypothetical protein